MVKIGKQSGYPKSWLPLAFRYALLIVFTALGVVIRQFFKIPIIPEVVELTPGFIMPFLTGLVLGPVEGAMCGLIVGIGGALTSTEFSLIPIVGNLALGLSTGVPTLWRHRIHRYLFIGLSTLSASIFGGFLSTYVISVYLMGLIPSAAAFYASIDAIQAIVWLAVAFILESGAVQPIIQKTFPPPT
jgi:hypothetical protein